MANENKYAKGIYTKKIYFKEGSIQKVSIQVDKFKEFLDSPEAKEFISGKGYLNLNIKDGKDKDGKEIQYVVIDTWKPTGTINDLPF